MEPRADHEFEFQPRHVAKEVYEPAKLREIASRAQVGADEMGGSDVAGIAWGVDHQNGDI